MTQARQMKEPPQAAEVVAGDGVERGRLPEPRSFNARQLTYRQLECLYWVLEGKSANDIGGILGISGRTVEEHLEKACAYFGVKSRHQAAWRARERGLLDAVTP